jgi:uncharacterized protein (TIGR03086 family)
MTTVADRYRRLAADLTGTIEQVPPDRWNRPSPCEGWTALDLARHIVDTHGLFQGLVGRALHPAPSVDEDLGAAWRAARDQMQADLDDPARAGEEFDGYFGRTTFATAIGRFVCFDLQIHRWDLGRATGLDVHLDPAELPELWRTAEGFGDSLRSEGVCGAPVPVPPDADEQTRLLCHLGRRV